MVGALLLTTTVSRLTDGRLRAECGFCISTMFIALAAVVVADNINDNDNDNDDETLMMMMMMLMRA